MVRALVQNDILWALRGAEPLFFGIVTRFWLRLMPLPPAMALTTGSCPMTRATDVTASLKRLSTVVPSYAEASLSLAAAPPAAGLGGVRATEAEVEHGRCLGRIAGCGDCQTPGHFLGQPDAARFLGGSDIGFEVTGIEIAYGPNLTPDDATGPGT